MASSNIIMSTIQQSFQVSCVLLQLKKKLKEKQKEKIRSKGGSTQSVTKSQTLPPNINDVSDH